MYNINNKNKTYMGNNIVSNCTCRRGTYLETDSNTLKTDPVKTKLNNKRMKKSAKLILKFLQYNSIQSKIIKAHDDFEIKTKNLLLISSRNTKGNFNSQSNFINQLQRQIDKILNHIDKNNQIDIPRALFNEINSYEFVANYVKDSYVNDIKENQINFYKEFFEKKGRNINEEIVKMLNYEYSYLYQIYFDDYLSMKTKKIFMSQYLRLFIKHFFFMYTMSHLNYITTYQNFKKIPIKKIKSLNKSLLTMNDITPSSQIKTDNNINTNEDNSILDNIASLSPKSSKYKKKVEVNLNRLKLSYYKGDIDSSTYLPSVRGEIIKEYKRVYYNGNFRYSKRHGIGILYRILSLDKNDNNIVFYRGEFHKGSKNGFGLSIVTGNNKYVISYGVFSMDNFYLGTQYIIEENIMRKDDTTMRNISYTKLEGEFTTMDNNKENVIDGNGKKTVLILEQNKYTYNYDIQSSYYYEGFFEKGKEKGKGHVKFIDNENNYSYDYNGNFHSGKMNGYGKIVYSDNFFIKSYEGLFYNDQKFYLYGIVKFKSGDVYEGFFDEHFLKSDLGLYSHYDTVNRGSVENYFGEFAKDKKEGIGRFVSLKKRKVLIGKYYAGDKNGIFSLITSKRKLNRVDDGMEENEKDEFNTINFRKKTGHKLYYNFENDDLIGELDNPYFSYDT